MRQYIGKLLLALLLSSVPFALIYYSQGSTTVTGTIIDPNANPYANGTASAFKSVNIGQNPGFPINVTTNASGFFTMTVPSPAAYVFTICAPPIELGPRANRTPPLVCFQTPPIAIGGVSVDISAQVTVIPPPIIGPQLGSGGGGSSINPGTANHITMYVNSNILGDSNIPITSIPFTNTNNTWTGINNFNNNLSISGTVPGQVLIVGAGGNIISSPSLTQSPTTGNVSVLSITGSGELDLVPNTGIGFQTRILANNDGTFNVFPSGAGFTQLALGSTGLVVAANSTNGTDIKFNDQVGGSASIGVASNSGSPNRINIPTTTGANGQCMITNGANPQQLSWSACGSGSGTVNSGTQYAIGVYNSSTNAISNGPTPPSINGVYTCLYNIIASVAVPLTCPQVGITDGTVNGATSTYTFLSSDCIGYPIIHDINSTSLIAATLPTPSTLSNPACVIIYENSSTYTDTITPTTWVIQSNATAAAASLSVPSKARVTITVDPHNATTWHATTVLLGNSGSLPSGNVVYSSPNCVDGPPGPTNCYYAPWDGQVTWECTYTSGNASINCPNTTFKATDVGKHEFATNVCKDGFAGMNGNIITIPYGTITTFIDSHHVVVSIAPTSTSTAKCDSFEWGTPCGAQVDTAWQAAKAACTQLIIPAAWAFTNIGQFNATSADANAPSCLKTTNTPAPGGASKQGPSVRGQGMATGGLLITPDFSFSAGSCNGFNGGCFLSTPDQMNAHDFTIYGAGLELGVSTGNPTTLVNMNGCDNCSLWNINLSAFENSDAAVTQLVGVYMSGAFDYMDHVIADGWGGSGTGAVCRLESNGWPQRISNSYCGDATKAGLEEINSSSVIQSVNNFFSVNGGAQPAVFTEGTLTSVNDIFAGDGTVVSTASVVWQFGGTVSIDKGYIKNYGTGSGGDVFIQSGGAMQIRDSKLLATNSTTGLTVSDSTSAYIDLGGNVVSTSTKFSNSGAGLIIGQPSSTFNSTKVSAAKLVLSAGWGSTAADTALSGGDFPIGFTVTNSGTGQGASPTITYTFPIPLIAAPLSCTATQTGGTNTIGTFTSSALSATGVTFTFSLTPTAGNTEIIKVECTTT